MLAFRSSLVCQWGRRGPGGPGFVTEVLLGTSGTGTLEIRSSPFRDVNQDLLALRCRVS